ncbi:winged helix-turn-helix transcriptional regulator (plasmid) [Aeromonas dhakensis]|uniref:winged helix-turn-helix domain-containing protein n=1 Tax=Aeromonas dhakensis TaxID=196024 RepID=UPI0021B1F64C|nr:winged helix-turn-helix domain-containing protein [Aeromonas dhakensis]UXB09951.1 winged helix-turn-helix transcriptional regulator [Aeromonas dhakensis]
MWVIEQSTGYVFFKNERVGQLGTSEILVFQFLSDSLGELRSKTALLDYAWPQKVVAPNSLTVAIKNIRKIFSARPSPIEIKTHHGKGYSLHGDISGIVLVDQRVKSLQEDGSDEENEPDDLSSEPLAWPTTSDVEPQTERATKFISWIIRVKTMIWISLCAMLCITFALASALLFAYNKPVHCEEIMSNLVVCGITNLHENDKALLKRNIEEQITSQGKRYTRYVYGYSYSPKKLVFYPAM